MDTNTGVNPFKEPAHLSTPPTKRISRKKIVRVAAGVSIFILIIIVIAFAVRRNANAICEAINIFIVGDSVHHEIQEREINSVLNKFSIIINAPQATIPIRSIEDSLKTIAWVQNAELFFNKSNVLEVNITTRVPIARIFIAPDTSVYMDTSRHIFSTIEIFANSVPIFTGVGKHIDSALVGNIVQLSNYILADSFWTAQIAQVNILPNNNFELVPTIGNHIILFGTLDSMANKFDNLYTFYKKAWLQNGINKYAVLDVRFYNSVIATQANQHIIVTNTTAPIVNKQTIILAMAQSSPPKLKHPPAKKRTATTKPSAQEKINGLHFYPKK